MVAPSQTNFTPPFDPTGLLTISGAQLLQLVAGLEPFTDKGLTVTTTDVAGNPQVPDANGTPIWQNYIWRRISLTSVAPYVWNPNGASDPTFLNWQNISVSTIGNGTIVNNMIAENTITFDKIVSLQYSQITGAPTGIAPTGAAGGDLTGTYPNPSVGAAAITSAKIAANTITDGNIARNTISPAALANDGIAKDMLRVNAAANAMEFFTPPVIFTSANIAVTGNGLKVLQVNTGGTDYQLVTLSALLGQGRFVTVPVGSNLSSGSQIVNSAHGLGATPTQLRGVIVCLTANAGYAIGDEVDCDAFSEGNSSASVETWIAAFAVACNNTNIFMSQAATLNQGLFVNHKTTGVNTAITQADWTAKIYAAL